MHLSKIVGVGALACIGLAFFGGVALADTTFDNFTIAPAGASSWTIAGPGVDVPVNKAVGITLDYNNDACPTEDGYFKFNIAGTSGFSYIPTQQFFSGTITYPVSLSFSIPANTVPEGTIIQVVSIFCDQDADPSHFNNQFDIPGHDDWGWQYVAAPPDVLTDQQVIINTVGVNQASTTKQILYLFYFNLPYILIGVVAVSFFLWGIFLLINRITRHK